VRILLDECLPAEFADELTGHEVRPAQQEGWSSLDNGELLRRAAARFDVFITVDKHIQLTQKPPEKLAVITIRGGRIASSRSGHWYPRF
jgi:hypothetical protein